jgi:hypothetical protein
MLANVRRFVTTMSVVALSVLMFAEFAHADYASTVLADNPIGYWHLGESTGTTAWDASGNGFHGVYVGNVALGNANSTAGLSADTAALFDGATGYIDVGTHAALSTHSGGYTTEAWINLAGATGLGSIMSTRRNVGSATAGGYGMVVSTTELRLTNFAIKDYRYFHTFVPGQWWHVAAVYHGDTFNADLYINGALQSTVGAADPAWFVSLTPSHSLYQSV